MRKQVFTGASFVTVTLGVFLGGLVAFLGGLPSAIAQGAKAVLPVFEVDSKFPTMPDHLLLGGVGGATADSHGNVWVFHRPHTLEEGNATENGYIPAPPVVEFSADGKYIQGWGGPTKGGQYEWFNRGGLHSAFAECPSCTAERRLNGDGRPGSGEHGIAVDAKDNVWLTGNGDGDGQVLKFSKDGKFLLQIGRGGLGVDSNDTTHLSRPAGITVYDKTNEVFVADGYGNRRVIVFDAATGAYKRHWGAYGGRPSDDPTPAYNPAAAPSRQFGNPVHCVRPTREGLVYVCDRVNNRMQIFRKDGTFVSEAFFERDTLLSGSVSELAFSPDAGQRFIYMVDGVNNELRIVERTTNEILARVGRPGRYAGQFNVVHNVAVDSQGNVYTTEVNTGQRVQKFRRLDAQD